MPRFLICILNALICSSALAAPPDARRSGGANAIDAAAATAAATPRTISFSGVTWTVKSSGAEVWGPGPNRFSDDARNVYVDDQGRLHLAITFEGGVWRSAEVIAQNSFGYGNYRFTLETDVAALDPNVVLGLFTWNDDPAFNHRELDIEFSRWGNPLDATNTQYTVQPYTNNANLSRWTLQPGYLSTTHSFRWSNRSVAFQSTSAGNTLHQWSYTRRSGVPRAGGENPRINLWLFQGTPPQNGLPVEVIVGRFEFVP